jgi:hypothetical protein
MTALLALGKNTVALPALLARKSSLPLTLLANLVMAWNTMKMQLVLDRWNTRRSSAVPPELIGRIAPTRTEGINLRGVFSFPIEQYAEYLLPTLAATKSRGIAA